MAAFLTAEGFEKASVESTTGPVGQAKAFVEAMYTPDATITFNGDKMTIEQYIAFLEECRGRTTASECTVRDFVLDGSKLAVRVTGISKVSGADFAYESFIFSELDKETRKIKSVYSRATHGPVGEPSK